MCGIVGYIGGRDAAPLLLEGLKRLEYRGYDSAGLAVLGGREPGASILRSEGKLNRLSERLDKEPMRGTTGIGHTRWATHGAPSEMNAHPHRQGKVSVVHNGIIENHMVLRRQPCSNMGCTFDSETDTEIFAHLIEKQVNGDHVTSLREAVFAKALTEVRRHLGDLAVTARRCAQASWSAASQECPPDDRAWARTGTATRCSWRPTSSPCSITRVPSSTSHDGDVVAPAPRAISRSSKR